MTTSRVIVVESKDGASLVVREEPMRRAMNRLEANVRVSVADARLSRALVRGIGDALRATAAASPAPTVRVVHLRTQRRLEALGPAALDGAIAIVRVTERNARRLPALVEAIRAAGPLGVQMVWDGEEPARSRVEPYVFGVLENARATPGGPPVVLAPSREPAIALRLTVAQQERKDVPS